MARPLVSVLVPAYRHRAYLPARIQSILAQTVHDIELIILDDASDDGTAEWLQTEEFPVPTRVVINKQRLGSTVEQWARGIALAQGEFVWIAEADDLSRPAFLQTLLGVLDAHIEAGLAFCQSAVIDETGRIVDSHRRWTDAAWGCESIIAGPLAVARALCVRNTIPNVSACVFRREKLLSCDWKRSDLRLCGDWYAYASLLRHSSVVYCQNELNLHRRHAGSVRALADQSWLRIEETYAVLTWVHRTFPEASARREEAQAAQFDSFLHLLDVMLDRGIVPTERTLSLATQFDPRFLERLGVCRPARRTGAVFSSTLRFTPKTSMSNLAGKERSAATIAVPRGLLRVVELQVKSVAGEFNSCKSFRLSPKASGWTFATRLGWGIYSPDGAVIQVELDESPRDFRKFKLAISQWPRPSAHNRLAVRWWRRRRSRLIRGLVFEVEYHVGFRVHFWLWRFRQFLQLFPGFGRSATPK